MPFVQNPLFHSFFHFISRCQKGKVLLRFFSIFLPPFLSHLLGEMDTVFVSFSLLFLFGVSFLFNNTFTFLLNNTSKDLLFDSMFYLLLYAFYLFFCSRMSCLIITISNMILFLEILSLNNYEYET